MRTGESQAFYDEVLGDAGFLPAAGLSGRAIGYGAAGKPTSGSRAAPAGPNREVHLAFEAADEDAVHAFYDAAVELGAESLHAPRLWPEYHPGYFGAFVRDPDGNNVEAVFHGNLP